MEDLTFRVKHGMIRYCWNCCLVVNVRQHCKSGWKSQMTEMALLVLWFHSWAFWFFIRSYGSLRVQGEWSATYFLYECWALAGLMVFWSSSKSSATKEALWPNIHQLKSEHLRWNLMWEMVYQREDWSRSLTSDWISLPGAQCIFELSVSVSADTWGRCFRMDDASTLPFTSLAEL